MLTYFGKGSTLFIKDLFLSALLNVNDSLHATPIDHSNPDWINCANEGLSCSPPVPALVRYGAIGTYATQQATGSIACTNTTFGDPVPCIYKSCDYLLSDITDSDGDGIVDRSDVYPNDATESADTDGDGLGNNADPFPNDPSNTGDWIECAVENNTCIVPDTAMVRYGANGQYFYQETNDSVSCSNEIFGDPIFLTFKHCDYYIKDNTPPVPLIAAIPTLSYTPVKGITLNWTDEADATFYRVLENPDGSSGFTQVGGDIPQGMGTNTQVIALYKRVNARYILQTCNEIGCIDANEVSVSSTLLTNSIGYVKASNTDSGDAFSYSVSLSGDGNTLAIGARYEDSSSTGINGDQTNNSSNDAGAVYVFSRSSNNIRSQQAYIKASNTGSGDNFGYSVNLDNNGSTLAVGAIGEDSHSTGIDGYHTNNSANESGAVYIFSRSGNIWSQQSYIKASNTDAGDNFGWSISLSADGNTMGVSAIAEDSNATGMNGNQTNNSMNNSGAAYVFVRSGNTWAIGAISEASNAKGIGGDQTNNNASASGAVYLY